MPQVEQKPTTVTWFGARQAAVELTEHLMNPAALEQIVATLQTPVRNGCRCASRILTTVEEAAEADQVPLIAYALAFHDVIETDTARPADTGESVKVIEQAYWLEQMGKGLEKLVKGLKEDNAPVDAAAAAFLGFFGELPSRAARVVVLSAVLHGPLVPWFHDANQAERLTDEEFKERDQRLTAILLEGRLAIAASPTWTQAANYVARLLADLSAADQDVVLGQLFAALSAKQTLNGILQPIAELLACLNGATSEE